MSIFSLFDAMTIQVSIPTRFNARKICDIIDLNQGISPREGKGTRKIRGIDRNDRKNQSIYVNYRVRDKTNIL